MDNSKSPHIVVPNTYCVVFLFCLSSSCGHYVASFSGLSFLIAPSIFSNVYFIPTLFIETKYQDRKVSGHVFVCEGYRLCKLQARAQGMSCEILINVRENRRDHQEWTIQIYWQYWANTSSKNKAHTERQYRKLNGTCNTTNSKTPGGTLVLVQGKQCLLFIRHVLSVIEERQK